MCPERMNDFAEEIISYYEEKCEKVNNRNVNKCCKEEEKGPASAFCAEKQKLLNPENSTTEGMLCCIKATKIDELNT